MQRRNLLHLLAAAGTLPLFGCQRRVEQTALRKVPMPEPIAKIATSQRMPVLFLAHGSPMLLDDEVWLAEFAQWAGALPKPRAVLMISAHWTEAPVRLAATRTVPLLYDFYGFPKRYYETKYPAPGAPELAERVRGLLAGDWQVTAEPERGLDHGAFIPMLGMYPKADVPVLQMSIPTMDPGKLLALGAKLAPLRDEGVLIIGSGFLTHNLRAFNPAPNAPPMQWAAEFDAWCQDVLSRRDFDALAAYRQKAPGVQMALPTHEHFVPVLLAAGASGGHAESVKFPITGMMAGSFTKRSVQFG